MKNLKIKLLFNILLIILFTISTCRYFQFINKYKFIEKDKQIYDIGIVKNIVYKNDYTELYIKSKYNYKAYIKEKINLNIGDKIKFKYTYNKITVFKNFNTFNYYKYIKSENINKIINIINLKVIKKCNVFNIKNYLNKKISKKKSKSYIYTFLFANKSYIDKEVKESYINNGISHLLCVSGFHVIFLLSFIKKCMSKLIKKEIFKKFILLTISIIYLYLTDFSISLFRAVLMYIALDINNDFNLNLNSNKIFFFVLFITIIIKPYSIYNIGFWYSFILCFYLIYYNSNCRASSLLKISIFAFLVSMPITIYINYKINFLSIIYNIMLSFVVCYILYPLSFFSIFINFFDLVLYKISSLYEIGNLYLNKINVVVIYFSKIDIKIIVLIYIIIFLFMKTKNFIFLLIILTLLFLTQINKYFDNNYYIYFLDVNQGDMKLFVSKKFKKIVIIDSGGLQKNNYLFSNISSFLRSKGITKINYLILTHGDYDHMGEAINLVNNFKVEKVIFNCGEFNDLEKELIKVLDKKKIKYYSCIKELSIDNNKLYFLQTKEYENENDNSNVIYTELNGYKFMFMGDASAVTEKEIIDKYNLTDIDVLKVGHHGSRTSSSKFFIDEINPKYSIISVGKNNRYGHPNKEALDNLKESKIYRTDQDGSIMFKIKNNKLKIETCVP